MNALLKVILVALLAVIVQQSFTVHKRMGGFAHYHKHHPGPCQKVQGIQPGSEDFHTLPNGLTFITSGLRSPEFSPKCLDFWRREDVKGRVYLLDLNNIKEGAKELKVTSTSLFNADTFNPHGISVWQDKQKGNHVVFVINHPYESGNPEDRIEKFVYDPKTQELRHQTYFSDPTMVRLNGILATGENSFYFTNSGYFRQGLLSLFEMLLGLPLTNVVYHDGNFYTVVDSGMVGANGIISSPDGQYLYVSEATALRIQVYKRNGNTNLTRVQTYPVYSLSDNLEIDEETGHVYVAAHPLGYRLMNHFDDVGAINTPSQVIQLQVKDGLITSSLQVLYDHGELISGSSSAVVYKGTVLVSSIFRETVTCKVNVPLL